MSTLEETREERVRLETLQDQIRTIDTAVEDARRAEESAARAERREKAEARKTLNDTLTGLEAGLNVAAERLVEFLDARDAVDQLRADAIRYERECRRLGCLEHIHGDTEQVFFSTESWRQLHGRVKSTIGGKILG